MDVFFYLQEAGYMREAVVIAGVYIATVIGAGFASGSELVSYFVKYGRISILGVLLCGVCFGFLATIIVKRVKTAGVDDFQGYLKLILPRPLVGVVDRLIVLFMLVVFVAMSAGAGEALSDFCGIPKSVGIILLCAVCFFVFSFDLKGLMAANGALSVLIIFGIVGVCWYIMNFRETTVFAGLPQIVDNWATSGASYVSYNILTASVILAEMGIKMKGRSFRAVGVISGAVIFLLLLCLWTVLSVYHGKIPLGSIPMLTICKRMGVWISLFYTLVLFAAMLTTALSNGYAVIDRLGRTMRRKIAIGLVLCIGYFGAGFDFTLFVDVLYRILGYMGFILVLFIFMDGIKMVKSENVREIKKKRVI